MVYLGLGTAMTAISWAVLLNDAAINHYIVTLM